MSPPKPALVTSIGNGTKSPVARILAATMALGIPMPKAVVGEALSGASRSVGKILHGAGILWVKDMPHVDDEDPKAISPRP